MDMATEIDIDDLPPKVLRKMLRQVLGKSSPPANKEEYEDREKAIEKADKEREELTDLQRESNGTPPEIVVLEEDLTDAAKDAKDRFGKKQKKQEKEEEEDD